MTQSRARQSRSVISNAGANFLDEHRTPPSKRSQRRQTAAQGPKMVNKNPTNGNLGAADRVDQNVFLKVP